MPIQAAPAPVVTEEAALWCRRGSPPQMESMHRHNDIELNMVFEGELHYLLAGQHLVIRAGQIAMFWAAQPHGLVDSRPGDVAWAHVPLSTVLSWYLPENELSTLARMEPLVVDAGVLGDRVEAMVSMWLEEYRDPEAASIVQLEIQAVVRRIARVADSARLSVPRGAIALASAGASDRTLRAMEMAQFVVAHFREAIAIEDIASSVHLTESHAMTLFRRAVGVTLGEYVTMCRVAEAQRLLLTTTRTSAEVAAAAGFGSLSSFYAHFSRACGMTPLQYRRQG